jgi:hypothetical protein
MMKLLGLALLAVGVVLLVMGWNASDSLSSEISEVFRGTPTDRAIWLLVAGGVTGLVGLALLFNPRRRPK